MPLKDIYLNKTSCKIGLWQITESPEKLLENLRLDKKEKEIYASFKNDKRKKEWLASRCLLQKMDENASIVYSKNGKPKLKNVKGFISLSHTKGWVSIVLSNMYKVGCDIEQLSSKVVRIKDKFASSLEQKKAITYSDKIIYYTIVWSAKEAIYKMFSEIETLEFKRQIEILTPVFLGKEGVLSASVNFENSSKNIELKYHIHRDYVLVYSLND